MFGTPFSPKCAACGAQRRPRRCGWQIRRFFFSRSPSSRCAADPSAASAAIVTDLRCRRGKIHDSSFKKCFDGFAGNFWYLSFFCLVSTLPWAGPLREHPCPLRRFAPAPPKGEPLASRATFRWTHKARQGAKERASLTGAAASGQEHLVKLLWSQTAGHYCFRAAQALLVPREPDRHASASPFGRGGCEADGEGKDAAGETLAQRQHRSDKEPAYRRAAALTQAACPLSHRCAMPAPPEGEPLACRATLHWTPKAR